VRRTKEEAEETKRKIVDAAVGLFEINGYEATRIEDIAEKAGLTRGAVYWHFKSKFELYGYILSMFERQLDRLVEESRHETASPVSRLRWLIINMITRQEILVGFRQMKMVAVSNLKVIETSSVLQKKGEKAADKYMNVLGRIFADGIAAGEIRKEVDPVHAAWLTAFFVTGAIGLNLHKPGLVELQESVPDIVDLFLKGIVIRQK
jgi:TetR/AcrR family acrAB operon transcriptional repressor